MTGDVAKGSTRIQTVLFMCPHNSARSQMAEGLLRRIYGDAYDVYSAGPAPTGIRPGAVQVMSEIGIDISGRHSRSILEFTGRPFGFVVTLCGTAREVCPVFPGAGECIYRAFEDPSGIARSEQESIEPYRRVRDEIKQWVKIRFGRGLKEHNRIGPDLTGD